MKKSRECMPRPSNEQDREVKLKIRESISKNDMIAIRQEGNMSVTRSASGAGGQNVNKTAKTAEFRWTPENSSTFNKTEKSKIIAWMIKNKPSQFVQDCEIYITSTKNKSLESNKKEVLKILHSYLILALEPEKKRIATKPSKGAQERRIQNKKKQGEKKRLRTKGNDW